MVQTKKMKEGGNGFKELKLLGKLRGSKSLYNRKKEVRKD